MRRLETTILEDQTRKDRVPIAAMEVHILFGQRLHPASPRQKPQEALQGLKDKTASLDNLRPQGRPPLPIEEVKPPTF